MYSLTESELSKFEINQYGRVSCLCCGRYNTGCPDIGHADCKIDHKKNCSQSSDQPECFQIKKPEPKKVFTRKPRNSSEEFVDYNPQHWNYNMNRDD